MSDQEYQKVYSKALKLIAGREYSSKKLIDKLLELEYAEDDVMDVVFEFKSKKWVDDQRFAEMFVRKKWRAGIGPVRITMELKQQGVAQYTQHALNQEEIDWYEAAVTVFNKKYQSTKENDLKALAKQKRFLQYRGFSFEHIQYVFSQFNP